MSFISVFIPAVIITFGLFVSLSATSTFGRGTVHFRMMVAAGMCLCLAGLWLEFFVSQVNMTQLILRVLVVLVSVAGVIAVVVAKDYDMDYNYSSSEVNALQTVFRAKAFGVTCAIMSLVLTSIVAGC